MHIIYTLTQTPVSVVIKALKFEGLGGGNRHGYTELFECRRDTRCLIHRSTVRPVVFAGLYDTQIINSPYRHNTNHRYLW